MAGLAAHFESPLFVLRSFVRLSCSPLVSPLGCVPNLCASLAWLGGTFSVVECALEACRLVSYIDIITSRNVIVKDKMTFLGLFSGLEKNLL